MRATLRKILLSGDFGVVFRGMTKIAAGKLISQLVTFGAIPFLTRLYTPADFGVLAVFAAFVAILAPSLSLRYSLAVPLPRYDAVAINLFAVSIFSAALISLILAVLSLIVSDSVLNIFGVQALGGWLWLVPVGALAAGTFEALNLWAIRRQEYGQMAKANVVQAISTSGFGLGYGVNFSGAIGLIGGRIFGPIFAAVYYLVKFGSQLKSLKSFISLKRMRLVALRYNGFPFFRLPSQLLLSFSQQAPLILVAGLYGASTGGQLGLAFSVLATPVALLGGSASSALYGEAAKIGIDQPRRLYELAQRTQSRLFLIALLPAIILFLAGEQIFELIFGSIWSLSGAFASVLSITLLFQFTSSPLMQMMNLLNQQSMFLIINLLRGLLVLTLAIIAHSQRIEPMEFVTLYAVSMAIMYLCVTAWILVMLRQLTVSQSYNPSSIEK